MKKTIILILLCALPSFLLAQDGNIITPTIGKQYDVSYKQLKQYEGLFEYLNNTTLKIAASPNDTVLYAIINDSKYGLTAIDKDLFMDMTKNEVRFFRDDKNAIAGYYVGKDTLKLLDSKIKFPKEMWYPRLSNSKNYSYRQPKRIKDDLLTGNINQSGLDNTLLTSMMDKIIEGQYPNVHSVLITKGDKLVFEEYFYEYNRNKLHELRSATKSFISALTGIAIDKGFIEDETRSVLSYFPEYEIEKNTSEKKKITVKHLLTNQSGLDCDISNANSLGNETVMSNTNDWVKFTLDLPMVDTAGGRGMYCSGNPITLGRIIEKTTKQDLPNFADQYLFKPLGIKNYAWNFKPDKTSAETFCQVYLTSRDMVKFGLLYLNKGKWNNKQVISTSWIEQSLKKHSTVQGVNYGYLWWNKYLDADGVRYYSYAAQGNGGQKIYVFQELDMAVVITGGNYNSQSPSDEIIKEHILPSFNNK